MNSVCSKGSEYALERLGPNENLLNDRQYEEFGPNNAIPSYDICPMLEKKPLLSDPWQNIMKDGVGLVFYGGATDFRVQLIKYTARIGFPFDYKRNDANYIHAICRNKNKHLCDWFIKARCLPVAVKFQIYEINLVHKCVGVLTQNEAKRLLPDIIGSLILHQVRKKPHMGGTDAKDEIKNSYGIDIPYWKAWRASENAKDKVWGSFDESYNHLRWYCAAVSSTNPGSVVSIDYDPETYHFERLFIAFKACIDGFKSCRPMLFIDGTFMKGRASGTLLAATAKDGDNGLYPVAIAVVSAENTENGTWFLAKIRDNVSHDNQIIFISEWRATSASWTSALCPNKEVAWQDLHDMGLSWNVVSCSSGDYEVNSTPSVRVDLSTRFCSCYECQISRFPCAHAIAVIRKNCDTVFAYVSISMPRSIGNVIVTTYIPFPRHVNSKWTFKNLAFSPLF